MDATVAAIQRFYPQVFHACHVRHQRRRSNAFRLSERDSSPFGGTWTFLLAPKDGGTEVAITENGEVYNVFFRALSRFVFGHQATIDGFLKALGAKFGEQVVPVDAEPAPAPS